MADAGVLRRVLRLNSTRRPIALAACMLAAVPIAAVVAATAWAPEVRTVVVSQIVSRVGVVPAPGRSKFATAVAGYMAAWRSLPASAQRVVVVRDNPKAAHGAWAASRTR